MKQAADVHTSCQASYRQELLKGWVVGDEFMMLCDRSDNRDRRRWAVGSLPLPPLDAIRGTLLLFAIGIRETLLLSKKCFILREI